MEEFKKKLKEVKVEGKRKNISSVLYSGPVGDHLLELKYIEDIYIGTQREARKRFQRNESFQRRQSFDRQQRSSSRDSRFGGRQLRFDSYKPGDSGRCD